MKLGKIYYGQEDLQRAVEYFEATHVKFQRHPNWAAQGLLFHVRTLKKLNNGADPTKLLLPALQNPQFRRTDWFHQLQQEL